MSIFAHIISGKNRGIPSKSSHAFTCMAILCLFLLSACGSPFSSSSSSGRNDKTRKIDTSNARSATLETNIGVNDLRSLAKPTSLQEDAPQNASASKIRTVTGNQLDVEPRQLLFAQNIKNTDDRFGRLEEAVQDLQDDFNKISPAITRLVAIEEDIKNLLDQLETLVRNDRFVDQPYGIEASQQVDVIAKTNSGIAPPAGAVPAPAATPQSSGKSRTLATAGGNTAQAAPKTAAVKSASPANSKTPTKLGSGDARIRVADHSGKTRLVLETSSKSNYQINFDQGEQLITIDASARFSESDINRLSRQSKRIAEVTIVPNGINGGQSIIILAKGISRLSDGTHIAPNKDNPNHRYFFDMFSN